MPIMEWYKFNVDGSLKDGTYLTCANVLRDHNGMWMKFFPQKYRFLRCSYGRALGSQNSFGDRLGERYS